MLGVLLSSCVSSPRDLPLPQPGEPATHRLAPGRLHRYTACLAAGEYLHLVFAGLDVAVQVFGPPGSPALPRLDTLTRSQVPEDVPILAREAGCFGIEVSPASAETGRYTVSLAGRRPAEGRDRDFTSAVYELQRVMSVQSDDAELARSADRLGQAAGALAAYGARWREAEARRLRSRGCRALEREACAREEAARAVTLFTATDHDFDLAQALNDRAVARRLFGCDIAGAERDQRLAEAFLSALEPSSQLSGTRRDLGILARNGGRLQESLDHLEAALAAGVEASVSDRHRASTLEAIGETHLQLGQWDRAAARFREARELDGGTATTAVRREREGWLLHRAGEHGASEKAFREAIAAAEEAGEPRATGKAWNSLGLSFLAQARFDEARRALQRALPYFRSGSADHVLDGRGAVLANLGKVALAAGRPEDARDWNEQAVAELRPCSRILKAVEASAGIARSLAMLGHLDPARREAEGIVKEVEALRATPRSLRYRRDFFAELRTVYEAAIDVYLQSHAADGDPAWNRRAFELFERMQDRSLLDLLAAGHLAPDPDRRRLTAELKSVLRRLQEAQDPARLAARLDELLWELDDRRVLPFDAATAEPRSAGEILDGLADDVTLVSLYLGEGAQALWLLDRQNGLTVHELPAREELLAAVDELRGAIPKQATGTVDRLAEKLARRLFAGGAMQRLRDRSLRITADAELDAVPFNLLRVPSPEGGFEYLTTASREMVMVPSVSSMLLLGERPRASGHGPPVVLADPDYGTEPGDQGGDDALRSAMTAVGLPSLAPLPRTRSEAEQIEKLLAPREVVLLLGGEATREAVLRGVLDDASVVHFATHALLPDNPELAGLALSPGGGADGDGFLQAYEIANLELSAELVVLSACETGARGLYGLPEAFLTAGARSVVVSLWPVKDRPTAELMQRFYTALGQGLSAAAALQRAQREMAALPGSRPEDWAGFTLLGDPAAAPFAAPDR